jgi:NitT/TauT family transport system permease protein
MQSKIAFGVLHGVIPITIFTLNAIRKIRPIYLKLARTFHLSRIQTIGTVVIPATLPEIISGLRVGFSLTLLGVLVGEMFASKRGLGHLIMNSIGLGDVVTTMAVAIFLFVLAGLGNAALLYLDRRQSRHA